MGKRTHGPQLLVAIEANNHGKVHEILAVQLRNKAKIRNVCISDIRRFPSEIVDCPLLLAASCPDPNIIRYMAVKHQVDINFVHKSGVGKQLKLITPLILAVRKGLYSTVETILSLNSDTNIQNHKGKTALHFAIQRADYRMAKMLLTKGAKSNLVDKDQCSPFHLATKYGHVGLVKLMLQFGGDLYKKGQYGAIPTHIAAKEGHIPLLRLFSQRDFNMNTRVPCFEEGREQSPLHVAAEEGQVETIMVLLDQLGADFNIRDSEGETPLHCTVINEYDPFGMKSKEEFTEAAKVLIKCGAEVNMKNGRGETPLHHAARNEFQKIVELLLRAGADPTLVDNDHNKPIDLVSEDDTVSRNCLKMAMENREKYMSGMLEMRHRGLTSSTQSFQQVKSGSQSSLQFEGIPRMSRSYSFQGISPFTPNNNILAGASIYNDSLYLQPLGSRSTLTRSESGTTLQGSAILSRQSSQSSLNSNNSSLYAHIIDSSFDKNQAVVATENQNEQSKITQKNHISSLSSVPQKVVRKKKSSDFRRAVQIPPDSDSSFCEEIYEKHSFPIRRSMSAEPPKERAPAHNFASLRRPKQKGSSKSKDELLFIASPQARKLPPDANAMSLCSDRLPGPIASSSPLKVGSVPNSPLISQRPIKIQRSLSLVNDNEINAVRNLLRPIPQKTKTAAEVSSPKTSDKESSSLWKVTPDTSLLTEESSGITSQNENLPTNGMSFDQDTDAVYENIPADEHVYGNLPSLSPESQTNVSPQVPSPHKVPTLKPRVSPKPRKLNDKESSKSPEITIKINRHQSITIKSDPATTEEKIERIENEILPEYLRPKLNGNVSDSDDSFFDDASFDTMSESSNRIRVKSPPVQTIVKLQKQSIADQLKKVVSDPKLKEWIAEQAAITKERQASIIQPSDNVDFGKEPESSTIKKNPGLKSNNNPNIGLKPIPNPKPRSLCSKNNNKTSVKIPQGVNSAPVASGDDFDDSESFDDGSFDTLDDEEPENVHNESVQYETMNNLNDPGKSIAKPVPIPRKRAVPSQSRTNSEQLSGSQDMLNWERVDPKDNDSYYWEHTSTEEFLEAKKSTENLQSPVHKLLPATEYMQMHGVVKLTQSQGHCNTSTSPQSLHSPTSPSLITFKSPTISPDIISNNDQRSSRADTNSIDRNQNIILNDQFPPNKSQSKGSIFVAIPGVGNLSDALAKPVASTVSREYEFHRQQLDLNNSSPKDIAAKLERRMSQEDIVEPQSPTTLGIPIINLDHSPGSRSTHNEDSKANLPKSDSSLSSHIPGPKNPDQLYAVVNKSLKRSPSDTSQISSVSTSENSNIGPIEKHNDSSANIDRVPSFSIPPVETSSDIMQEPHIPLQEGIYEELPQKESPKRRVTIGTEEIIFPDDPERKSKDFDHRLIKYDSKGKMRISVVGGNADGIFIHRIDPGSDAEQQGLMEGDQILKINNQSVTGMTKEEITLMLMSVSQVVILTVRYKRDRYENIVSNSGMGDSFFVRANFNHAATQPEEMNIREGDVLSVRDTLPNGQMGSWRALKVNARPNEAQHGLVPNEGRAEQVALARKQIQNRGRTLEKEPKGGILRRSFRRSKSAERLSKETDAFNRDQIQFEGINKPAYERVEQRPPGFFRPVAIVGLFCDTVRDRLAQDSPGIFERAPPEVEIPTSKEESHAKQPINLNIIRSITDRRKHCLMIISPRAIQYLLQTQLHPIIIYLHPGSKNVIKALRSQFAPHFGKRSSFMYDEAVQFEKTYAHLFTATVTYTVDDSWFTLLKDTINRIQNQALWQLAPKRIPSSSDFSPDQSHKGINTNNTNKTIPRLKSLPRGRTITRQIPSAIQNVMQRHTSNSNQNGFDLDTSITSITSMESMQQRQPMTLTYDGYFLSGPGGEELQSSSSSQSLSGPVNGHVKGMEISPAECNSERPKSILKKRSSAGSVNSVGAASDYESDVSISGEQFIARKSLGQVNGYPVRNDLTVLQMEPKRIQQSPMMQKQRFVGNRGAISQNPPATQKQVHHQINSHNVQAPPVQNSNGKQQCKETDL